MSLISALYCHLPFCHTICPFCAFPVHVNRPELHAPYLESLHREIALYSGRFAERGHRVASLYFGGGTPSTVNLESLAALLEAIRGAYPLAHDAEIAFEINPEDASAEYLDGLHALGINRISLGVQSLDTPTLAALGRNNSAAQSRRALEVAMAGPIANFNVDLMLGAPGIAAAAFRSDVEAVAAIKPAHLSFYALDVEPSTPFGRNARIRRQVARQQDEQAELMLWAAGRLNTAGYRHYEVSNFCQPGREGRQNRIVWDGGCYLGFGLGAHSYVDGERWWNKRHLRAYCRDLTAGRLPVESRERPSSAQVANERLMLSLRRAEGLDVSGWTETEGGLWDQRRKSIAARLVDEGKAVWRQGRFCLTEQGLLLADAITEQLMLPLIPAAC